MEKTNSLNFRNQSKDESASSSSSRSSSSRTRNLKFKYLTTNMQNLLKSFNENLSSPRKETLNNEADFDFISKKLKQIQVNPIPSTANPVHRSSVRSKTIPNRSCISQLDHHNHHQNHHQNHHHNHQHNHHYIQLKPKQLLTEKRSKQNNSSDRSQSHLNFINSNRTSNNFDNHRDVIYENEENNSKFKKSKSSQIMNCSSKSSFISDSFDSERSSSTSSSNSSSNRSRSTSPPSLNRKSKNKLAFSENISERVKKTSSLQRRSSVNNLDSPRAIVIRREKSINCQTNRNTDLPIMKQALLASIVNTSKEDSKQTSSSLNSNTNESNSSYITKINELKNKLFVLEIELDSEKKKLCFEKEHKNQLINELKLRYETEKMAALKALEAKLNADKLYEINKVKEMVDMQKREQIDQTQKSFDTELINLKLKLRDKAEQYVFLKIANII